MDKVKIFIIAAILVLAGTALVTSFAYLQGDPLKDARVLLEEKELLPINKPFVLEFSKPVSRKSLSITISPELDGEVGFRKPFVGNHLMRQVAFSPLYTWQPGKTYLVEVKGVRGVFGGRVQSKTFSFSTSPVARVTNIDFGVGERGAPARPTIKIELDRVPEFTDIKFITSPAVEWRESMAQDKRGFILTTGVPLELDTVYNFKIEGSVVIADDEGSIKYRGNPWVMYQGEFKTEPPPKVVSLKPTGSMVSVHEPVVIEFDSPVKFADGAVLDAASTVEIIPKTDGTAIWNDSNTVLTFAPKDQWAYDTTYRVFLSRALVSRRSGAIPAGTGFYFRTIGPVKIEALFPANGSKSVDVTADMRVTFNQKVKYASVEPRLKLLDAASQVQGKLAFDGTTAIFEPKERLMFNKEYRLIIEPGVESFEGGLASATRFDTIFTTQQQSTLLPIAFDRQDRALSCEAATVKMALSHYGIKITEKDIFDKIGFDPTPHQGDVWGDPDVAFVGSPDGEQNKTGYGVHWGPIQRAASAWRPSEQFTDSRLEHVLDEVLAGHPVIVWGVLPGGKRDSWFTPEGKKVNAWKGVHTYIVVGFVGPKSDPDKVVTMDPLGGKKFWTKDDFINNWSSFNFSGVVVR